MKEVSVTLAVFTSIADILVAVAYFAIPAELWYFYRKLTLTSNGFPAQFKKVLYLFVMFICCCGLTHTIMAYYTYYPTPMLNCLMKWITATISLYTSYQLLIVVPRILYYPIYTQGIENENLQRQVHEHFLQENINIFRQIREYTQTLNNKSLQNLYDEIVQILHSRLKLETALYINNTQDASTWCRLFSKLPLELECPEVIDIDNPSGFNGKWWLLYFDTGYENLRGYIALRTSPQVSRIVTRKNLILEGQTEETRFLLPETEASVSIDMTDKSYFTDIILDIVEHFESNLVQSISREKNMDLIEELTKQNKELSKSRLENQIIAKQSRDWLSVMSHEMRTPLFAIESLTELTMDKVSKTEDIYSSLNLVNSSAKHLTEIINNILDFSKIENGDYNLDSIEFNIKETVSDSVSINVRNEKRIYPQVCIFFADNLPDIVISDSLRIKQILVNLVSNALKFTPDEGNISISVNIINKDEDQSVLHISVADTGIGIKKEDHDKIFKQFSQSDASITRKFGGSGLGLSICKRLCLIMGGDITFRDNEPQGTIFEFHVTVRNNKNSIVTATSAEKIPEMIKDWQIFLLDDNYLSSVCSVKHLAQIGMKNVVTAETCDELTEENLSKFDIILINIRSKCIITDTTLLEELSVKYGDKILIQGNPYVREFVKINAKYEILGPVIQTELTDILRTLVHDKGLLQIQLKDKNELTPLNMHILVAEDNYVNQMVIEKLLKKMSITADFADNGQIAVDKYIQNPIMYNVILMDIMMPIMDGYSACKEIRKRTSHPKKPWIIALTANAFWEDRLKASESGMNDFLTKPTKLKDLYNALKKTKNI